MPSRQRLVLILLIPLTFITLILLGALLAQPAQIKANDLRLADSIYLSAANATWLVLIAFAPLFIALIFVWQTEHPNLDYFQPELTGVFALWISFANGYAVLYALRFTGLLPKFETDPQTLTDPRLLNLPVNFLVLGLTLATVVFFIWFLFGRRYSPGAMADRIHLPHRRLVLLFVLAFLSITIWLFGGLNYALLMVIPIWLWVCIEPATLPRTRLVNTLLALGGGLSLLWPLFTLPPGVSLGSVVAAAAYLILGPLDVLTYFLALALWIRFLRLGLSQPYVAPPVPEDPLVAFLRNQ